MAVMCLYKMKCIG